MNSSARKTLGSVEHGPKVAGVPASRISTFSICRRVALPAALIDIPTVEELDDMYPVARSCKKPGSRR